jgi:hypothetical protein
VVIHQCRKASICSDADSNTAVTMPQQEPNRKRHKKDNETALVCNRVLYVIL